MVGRGSIARVGIAGALGITGLMALASPAGAAKVSATGTATCSVAATMSFNPPLQPGIGTLVPSGTSELVTLSPFTFSGCTGSSTTLPISGVPSKTVVVKVKASSFNRKLYAGGCLFLSALQLQIKHTALDWTTATGALRPTKLAPGIAGLSADGTGNLGFSFGGSATGSFAGSATLGLYTDATGTTALENCESNLGGPISSLTVDPTQSSLALG